MRLTTEFNDDGLSGRAGACNDDVAVADVLVGAAVWGLDVGNVDALEERAVPRARHQRVLFHLGLFYRETW